ncbi:hypothetical protein JCM16138_07200 [Thermococcus atlanticus]
MKIIAVSRGGLFSGRVKNLVETMLERAEFLENTVLLGDSIKAEYGKFTAVSSVLLGSRMGRGQSGYISGWLFNTFRRFVPEREVVSSELPMTPAEYRMEIDMPGSGKLELPGYRLHNGVLLLYITPSYRFVFSRDVLTAGGLEDYAQLSITPLEAGFRGRLDIQLSRAEYAEVGLRGERVEDQIFIGDKSGEFTYEFLKEPLLIISHERLLDPPKLQKALNLVSILSGHGKFELFMRIGKSEENMELSVELDGE